MGSIPGVKRKIAACRSCKSHFQLSNVYFIPLSVRAMYNDAGLGVVKTYIASIEATNCKLLYLSVAVARSSGSCCLIPRYCHTNKSLIANVINLNIL